MVQSNGIPYNNPNKQNSNFPNNSPSGIDAQNKSVPHQNYNKIFQSSGEWGYNSKAINEKLMK